MREAWHLAGHHFHGIRRLTTDTDLQERANVTVRQVVGSALIPATLGITVLILDPNGAANSATGFLAFSGLIGAFFFQVSVQWVARSQEMMSSQAEPTDDRRAYILLLHDVGASAGFAALVSLACAVCAGVLIVTECGWPQRIAFAACVFLASYLMLTVIRVVLRAFGLTRGNLIQALSNDAKQERSD